MIINVFSATDAPPNEAKLPKAASPCVVPGANNATFTTSSAIGKRATSSAVIVKAISGVDASTNATLEPVTEIISTSPDVITTSIFTSLPMLTLALSMT